VAVCPLEGCVSQADQQYPVYALPAEQPCPLFLQKRIHLCTLRSEQTAERSPGLPTCLEYCIILQSVEMRRGRPMHCSMSNNIALPVHLQPE